MKASSTVSSSSTTNSEYESRSSSSTNSSSIPSQLLQRKVEECNSLENFAMEKGLDVKYLEKIIQREVHSSSKYEMAMVEAMELILGMVMAMVLVIEIAMPRW